MPEIDLEGKCSVNGRPPPPCMHTRALTRAPCRVYLVCPAVQVSAVPTDFVE